MDEQQQQEEEVQQEGECGVVLEQNRFLCSVCLELLRVPVTIQCGHTYCWSCIEKCWDLEEQRGRCSCPQCRERFHPRPALKKNNILAEVVEKLEKTITQQTRPGPAPASPHPADVTCDLCCGPHPNRATTSCLTCLVSYCQFHLEPHCSVPVLKMHQLVSATTPVQEKMCMRHSKLMDVYCRTDKTSICYLCTMDKHKGHDVVSAAAERANEEMLLIFHRGKVEKRFRERKAELKDLRQAVTDFKSCSQGVLTSTEKLFDDMIGFIRQKQTLTRQLIEAQESAAFARAEELQQLLEEETADLKRRASELEQLSHTDDHIHFIQTFQSLSTACESPDLPPDAVVRPRHSLEAVTDGVSKLRANVEKLLNNAQSSITAAVAAVDVVLPPVPRTREECLRYCCSVTLDVTSANLHLSVSQEGRRVTCEYKRCYSAPSEDRFTHVKQVLCREGLSQRAYWEVGLSGHAWSVAVAYKDAIRTSYESEFGKNNTSWSLECSQQQGYTFRHNAASQAVAGPTCSRIGVFLDYKAGTLTFYSVSDKMMTLLHKERTSFTRPLYPGLGLKESGRGSGGRPYAELLKLC